MRPVIHICYLLLLAWGSCSCYTIEQLKTCEISIWVKLHLCFYKIKNGLCDYGFHPARQLHVLICSYLTFAYMLKKYLISHEINRLTCLQQGCYRPWTWKCSILVLILVENDSLDYLKSWVSRGFFFGGGGVNMMPL